LALQTIRRHRRRVR
jgi:hypothetical protein